MKLSFSVILMEKSVSVAVISFLILLIVFQWLNVFYPRHLFGIFYRWARWLLFSSVASGLFEFFQWSEGAFLQTFFTAFIGWLMGETLLYWLMVRQINYSDLSLFPRFKKLPSRESWPVSKRFLMLRDEIRKQGFHLLEKCTVDFQIEDFSDIRIFVFGDLTSKVRLEVWFIPHSFGNLNCFFTLSSCEANKKRIITSNANQVFGGYYPEKWDVQRLVFCSSLKKMLERHLARINGKPCVSLKKDAVWELNHQQSELEIYNLEQGFLIDPNMREEYGQLSSEGRYRIWREIWTLNYLGICD